MEQRITGRGVIQHGSPGQGKNLKLWGAEELLLQNISTAQPKETKWQNSPVHTDPRAWSSTREASMQRKSLCRNPRKSKSLPRSFLWYPAQHKSAKWEGEGAGKAAAARERPWDVCWLQHSVCPTQPAPKKRYGEALISVSMENGKLPDVTDLSLPTDLLSQKYTKYQPISALQRGEGAKQRHRFAQCVHV